MKRLLTLLAAAVLVLSANIAIAGVNSSPHDIAGITYSGGGADDGKSYGLCEICHVPHAANSGTNTRLWRTAVTAGAPDTTWELSVVGRLCGTCHRTGGQLLGISNNTNNTAATNQNALAFDAGSHDRDWTILTNAADNSNLGDTAIDVTVNNKPYAGVSHKIETNLIECTSCHNPHDDGSGLGGTAAGIRPFLRAGAVTGGTGTISGHCADCHRNRYNTTVGLGNGYAGYGMHPINVQYTQVTNNGMTGATLKYGTNVPAGMRHTLGANSQWDLGAKFQTAAGAALANGVTPAATHYIGCQTCHAIHNPATGTGTENTLHLLALNNIEGATAALCEGCHADSTGSSGVNTGKWPVMVGGTWGDHPIDSTIEAGNSNVIIDRWYSDNTTDRLERHPGAATGATDQWPRGDDSSAEGTIICTSCHSAHRAYNNQNFLGTGAVAGKLRRRGNYTNNTHGTGLTPGNWCNSCHADPSPLAHHSNTANVPGTTTDTGNSLSLAASGVSCASCHGTGAGGGAHNGFIYYGVFVNGSEGNQKSQLCEYCHLSPGYPTTKGADTHASQLDPVFATGMPSGDYLSGAVTGGPDSTKMSHFLGDIYSTNPSGGNATNSINLKAGYWQTGFFYNGTSVNSYSKYGVNDTHGRAADAYTNGAAEIICESCHSVLYNVGASSLYNGGAGPTRFSGWANNLLLQDYRDDSDTDGRVTGSGFCVGCHNRNGNDDTLNTGTGDGFVTANNVESTAFVPASMHPMTNWTITRATDAGYNNGSAEHLKTGDATRPTYADANKTQSNLNYPTASNDGNQMDCDSCHRPHIANGKHKPAYATSSVPVILEIANGNQSSEYDTLCTACHAY